MSAHAQPGPEVGSSTVRLTIPAKPEYITLVRLALSGLSRLRPLDEETLGDLKLAVTEDEPTIKPYDEALWAELEDGARAPVETSLQLLTALHERWVMFLRSLTPAQCARN